MKYIIKIKSKACDAAYIDIIKAVNRMMEAKDLEKDYLGCNAWMRDLSRNDQFAEKLIHVDMGFDEKPADVKAVVDAATEALKTLYEEVKSVDFVEREYPLKKQFEIRIDVETIESIESEKKLSSLKAEERKKAEEFHQEELKKKLEEEKHNAEIAEKEREAAMQVKQLLAKLAKCKTQEQLDEVFDEVEELKEEDKISEKQFERLLAIYNEAEDRIKKGVDEKDDSLFMRLKYASQIKNAKVTADIMRIRKFIKQHFDEGRMDNATYEMLEKLLNEKAKKLQTFGSSADAKKLEYRGATFHLEPDGYYMIDKIGTLHKTIEDVKKTIDWAIEKHHFDFTKDAIDVRVLDIFPRKGESKKDFISRFMSKTAEEYPDQKQRLAIAYSYWNRR